MGLQSARSTFGFTFSSLPLGILNLFSLLLFPWTLSILLSPGLIWYSTNWLHQKVIMLHIIVTLLFFYPCGTSNLSTCKTCFMRLRVCQRNPEMMFELFIIWGKLSSCLSYLRWVYLNSWLRSLLHYLLLLLMKLMIKYAAFCCRENLPAVFPQSDRAVRAAEEARLGCSVPDSPLPRQNSTQVRPTSLGCLVWTVPTLISNTPVTSVIRSRVMLCSLFVLHCLPQWQSTGGNKKSRSLWPTSPILDVISSFKAALTTISLFSLLRRFALTTKIPDTKGCHKCCIGEWPFPPNHSVFIYSPFHRIKLCQYTRNISEPGRRPFTLL